MRLAEIRARFLAFFAQQGHTVVESSPLIPHNDPTLLFTAAGMVQFKDCFLGLEKRAYTRAASCQKCLRAGGKHNDLENVGFTARHHTFFEMLGNFSFGDYFKQDAISYAWSFVTEVLKFDPNRLYVTVFETDDEAFDIWHQKIGLAKERIFRFGEKDNFWSAGDTGPCGPCSELFYDRGPDRGCGKSTCAMGCDCDRYMEFWNLVFMQYDRDATGKLTPLPRPSVDTGAGLERLAVLLQDVDATFETDIFVNILKNIGSLLGKPYDPQSSEKFSYRVIADHARAAAFLIADGVLPANEGRGYVLRRILRRAVRYGRDLGFKEAFMYQVVAYVRTEMGEAYPELLNQASLMDRAIKAEEDQFLKTLERGLQLLESVLPEAKSKGILDGSWVFKLYDTYGFPKDLTRTILDEQGISLDEEGFEREMARQKEQSKQNWKGSGESRAQNIYFSCAEDLKASGLSLDFIGYDQLRTHAQCLALISQDETPAMLQRFEQKSRRIAAVFNPTVFYPEGGGQIGDRGQVSGPGFFAQVIDVQKPVPDLAVAILELIHGHIEVGQHYLLETEKATRDNTARNHSATHLLHAALRNILGDHVKQAGSLVTPEFLRFDFSHFQALTQVEKLSIENAVNEAIWANHRLEKVEMPKEEALAEGAIAFFGEKYADKVRVVKIGGISTELCGGTHVNHTGDIHLFKIQSEGSIAAGVRRIVALTGAAAFNALRAESEQLGQLKDRMKAKDPAEMLLKLDKLEEDLKSAKKDYAVLKQKEREWEYQKLLHSAQNISGTPVLSHIFNAEKDGAQELRAWVDLFRARGYKGYLLLGIAEPDQAKVAIMSFVSSEYQKKLDAQSLIRIMAPLVGGRGGGKAEQAQAGGTDAHRLEEALQAGLKAISQSV